MLCDICNKKKAKIFYTEIVNGEKREQHLCEDCAVAFTGIYGGHNGEQGLSLGNMLSGILGSYAKGLEQKKGLGHVCSECGRTEQEVLKTGRFGCANCYNAFSKLVGDNLRVIQGADMHFGKRPGNAEGTSNLKKLQREKKEAENSKTAENSKAAENAMSAENAKAVQKSKSAGKKKQADKADSAKKAGNGKQSNEELNPIDALTLKLKTALEVEDYEEAARLRDQIKALREDGHGEVVSKAKRDQ